MSLELLLARVTALSKAASSPSICNPDVYYLLENFYGAAIVKIDVGNSDPEKNRFVNSLMSFRF